MKIQVIKKDEQYAFENQLGYFIGKGYTPKWETYRISCSVSHNDRGGEDMEKEMYSIILVRDENER